MEKNNRALEILKEEWAKVTTVPFDNTMEVHLNYALKAMNRLAAEETKKGMMEMTQYQADKMGDGEYEEIITDYLSKNFN